MRPETANILAILNEYTLPNAGDDAQKIADDFRKRRIEKNMTRRAISDAAKVPLANVARFEQKGLISLTNLIKLARALGYIGEVKGIFAESKFSTMSELLQIRQNKGKKKAYTKKKHPDKDD